MMFSYFMLYVKDIDEHIEFYRDIMGLEMETYYEEEGGMNDGMIKVAFMVDKGKRPMIDVPMIELVANSPDDAPVHCGYQIGIQVDSSQRVDKLMKEHGYPLINGPLYREDGRITLMEYVGPEGTRVATMEVKEI
ncbi:VOC family protein [Lactonifactor longoviformis]|uniref:VOC family protein n=1 Tax=Lactonifactor longoviformis TaxID=341220 RepID=UPI0036F28276